MESGKKSYEIAYALWRIASHVRERALADGLRNKAIAIIGFSADGKREELFAEIEGLEILIKFAVDVAVVNIGNAAILMREIGNLKSAIDIAAIDIADMFSRPSQPQSHTQPQSQPPLVEDDIDEAFDEELFVDSGNNFSGENGKKAEARQSAILDKIRQAVNCRLSDIQAILPNTSERTIRYDLESLVRRNLIERVGVGGRSVYYHIK